MRLAVEGSRASYLSKQHIFGAGWQVLLWISYSQVPALPAQLLCVQTAALCMVNVIELHNSCLVRVYGGSHSEAERGSSQINCLLGRSVCKKGGGAAPLLEYRTLLFLQGKKYLG